MGAGKSTVGKQLAKNLNKSYLDLDQVIESKAGMPILKIFKNKGQNYFRELEYKCLLKISAKNDLIVATGGGIILLEKNTKIIRQTGLSVYLKWPIEVLFNRVKKSSRRPLLNTLEGNDLFLHINKIFSERSVLYEDSDYVIEGNAETTVNETIRLIKEKVSPYFH